MSANKRLRYVVTCLTARTSDPATDVSVDEATSLLVLQSASNNVSVGLCESLQHINHNVTH